MKDSDSIAAQIKALDLVQKLEVKINREKERTAKLIRELQGKNTEVEIQEILL